MKVLLTVCAFIFLAGVWCNPQKPHTVGVDLRGVDEANSKNVIFLGEYSALEKPRLKEGDLESNDFACMIEEVYNLTLTPLPLVIDNRIVPGQGYTGPLIPPPPHQFIRSGAVINSYLLLFDNFEVTHSELQVEAVFEDPIIGFVYLAREAQHRHGPINHFIDTNTLLGLDTNGVDFSHIRGLTAHRDNLAIAGADPRKLYATFRSDHEGFDAVRIFTSPDLFQGECSYLNVSKDVMEAGNYREIPFTFNIVMQGVLENNDWVAVLPERSQIAFEGTVEFDTALNTPRDVKIDGGVRTVNGETFVGSNTTLLASYLVSFDLEQKKGGPKEKTIDGRIDFQDRIVGLVWDLRLRPENRLALTNPIFKPTGKEYAVLEDPQFGWTGLDAGDMLWINDEEPTVLHFSLKVEEQAADFFRVVTACEGVIKTPELPTEPCGNITSLTPNVLDSGDLDPIQYPVIQEGVFETPRPAKLLIFRERRNHTLTEDVTVDIALPASGADTFGPVFPGLNDQLVQGTPLNSHLLVFDTTDLSFGEEVVAVGSITFDNPIIGLVYTDEEHNDHIRLSSPFLGVAGVNYGRDNIGVDDQFDAFSVAINDPNTFNFDFLVRSGGIDVIRIITACGFDGYHDCTSVDVVNGPAIVVPPPADASLDQFEGDTVKIWRERFFISRNTPTTIDRLFDEGSTILAEDGGLEDAIIPAGTIFSTFMIHFDPSDQLEITENDFTIRFGGEIIGVSFTTENLANTRLVSGYTGTQYEASDPPMEIGDSLTFIDVNTISFHWETQNELDDVRVFVRCPESFDNLRIP